MLTLIVFLAAPLVAAPLIILCVRHLFAIFVREGAELFVGMDVHKPRAMALGTDIAILNMFIFALAWWAAVVASSFQLHSFVVASPFVAALALAMIITTTSIQSRLKLSARDAFMVGLLTCAGGNLPLIIATPLLLMLVNSHDIVLVAADVAAD